MTAKRLYPVCSFLLLALVMPFSRVLGQAAEAPDQQEIAMHYSLYYEDYKNGNYESALPNLRWILEKAPTFPRKNDVNFERAVKVYSELALKEEDPEIKRSLLDTALTMFDTAVTTLKDAGADIDDYEWTFKKGKFIHENSDTLGDLNDEIGSQYRAAYDLDPQRIQPYYVNYLIAEFVQNEDKDGALKFMEDVESQVGENEEIAEMINRWRGSLFTSPEERYEFITTKLETTPNDCELIVEKFGLALDLGYRSDVYAIEDRLVSCEESARSYRLLAELRLEDGDTEEAMTLYEKALALPGSEKYARDIYYNMGVALQQMGRLSRARTQFRKAIEVDNTFGASYMAIGDLYVTAVANCGSFEREDRAVYWLVVDYYNRAKANDPNMAAAANRKITQYRKYMPDQEALFFKGWKPGDKYTVAGGCYAWINESTTVKSP